MTRFEGHIRKMAAQLDKWDVKIVLLAARAAVAEERVRDDCSKEVEELAALHAGLRERFELYEKCGPEAWDAFQPGMTSAWRDVEAAFEEINGRCGRLRSRRPSARPTGGAAT